jgi:hypothetical protein
LFYENPIYGLDIGIDTIVLYEKFALEQKQYGRVIQQPVATGVILEKDRLRKTLEKKRDSCAANFEVDQIIKDIYELTVELFNSDISRYYHFNKSEVPTHIYEAETRLFYETKPGIQTT